MELQAIPYDTSINYPSLQGTTDLGVSRVKFALRDPELTTLEYTPFIGDPEFFTNVLHAKILEAERLLEKVKQLYRRAEQTTAEISFHHDRNIDFQDTDTFVLEEPLIELPEEISAALDRFAEGDFDRLEAYEHAERVVELLEEYPEPWEHALALRIPQLNENRRGTLYGALADCEVRILNLVLLNRIADDIGSENKSLAQSAAACLYWCGAEAGRQILNERMEGMGSIPHRHLIISLLKLLR